MTSHYVIQHYMTSHYVMQHYMTSRYVWCSIVYVMQS